MRNLIIGALVLVCTIPSIAQNQMYKTEGERILREALDWIPDNDLNGGLLIDRYPEFTPIRDYDGNRYGEPLQLIEWWSIYASLYCAQRIEADFDHPDEEQKRIHLRDTRDIFEHDEYSAALSMIHVDYSTLIDDSTERQNFSFDGSNIQYNGTDFGNAIHDHYCFAAAITYNGPITDDLTVRIESESFFSNREDIITGIDIDINDGEQIFTNLNFGSEIVLRNLADSNIVEVALHLQSGEVKYSLARLDLLSSGNVAKSNATNPDDEHIRHDFKYGLEYKVGIWYGCNSHGSITKPFIALSGFAPEFLFGFAGWEWGDINPVSLKTLYDNYNNSYLLDELRAKGYDIILVSSKDGMIETDGLSYIVEDAIRWVNSWNPEGHENVVMGASQGAMALRLALARMEKEYLAGTGQYHRTKMYISWEGEHRGANVPVGTQAAITRLNEKYWIPGFWESNLDHWFNSVVMSEMVLYNDENTFGALNSTPPTSGVPQPDALPQHYALQAQLHSYNHNFTEISGYPTFLRRVAISNGSSNKNTFFLPEQLAVFFRLGGVGGFYQKLITGTYDSYHNTGDKVIYADAYEESILQIVINDETFYHSGSFPTYASKIDGIPGSVFGFSFFGNGIHRIACEKIGNSTVFPSGSFCADQIQEFVPTYSSFDLTPSSTYFSTADFDAFDAGVMYSDYPNITNGSFGYPHIGLGSSSLNHTAFDALYADAANDHHVLGSDGSLKNFILWEEIQPDHLTLQNRNVGEHLITYSAYFEAERDIQIGENVTVKEPIGKFKITEGTSSVIRAGDAVYLQPGTSLEYGSSTLVHIGYIGCTKSNFADGNQGVEAEEGQTYSKITSEGEKSYINDPAESDIKVYPNPNKGTFTVHSDIPKTERVKIQIIDLVGKIVYTRELNGLQQQQIQLKNVPSGIYLIKVESREVQFTDRLIIQ